VSGFKSEYPSGIVGICKLKLVKRQMYGRGKIDLLRARIAQPA